MAAKKKALTRADFVRWGKLGGKARAAKLSAKEKSAIASRAAQAREAKRRRKGQA